MNKTPKDNECSLNIQASHCRTGNQGGGACGGVWVCFVVVALSREWICLGQ